MQGEPGAPPDTEAYEVLPEEAQAADAAAAQEADAIAAAAAAPQMAAEGTAAEAVPTATQSAPPPGGRPQQQGRAFARGLGGALDARALWQSVLQVVNLFC
jgi:hypothetical protein